MCWLFPFRVQKMHHQVLHSSSFQDTMEIVIHSREKDTGSHYFCSCKQFSLRGPELGPRKDNGLPWCLLRNLLFFLLWWQLFFSSPPFTITQPISQNAVVLLGKPETWHLSPICFFTFALWDVNAYKYDLSVQTGLLLKLALQFHPWI